MVNLQKKTVSPAQVVGFILFILYTVALFAFANVALAENAGGAQIGDQIQTNVQSAVANVYSIITSVVGPIAAVALAICAAKILWGSQKAAEEAKSFAIRLIIALILVFGAPLIVSQIKGWIDTSQVQNSWNGLKSGVSVS